MRRKRRTRSSRVVYYFSGRLLPLRCLERPIESLIRRIAACLSRLRRLQSLIRSALSAGGRLLSLGSRALCSVRRVLGGFCRRLYRVELLYRDVHAAGHDRKAANERRCPQSSLDFYGH